MDETFFRFQIHMYGAAAGGDILDFTTVLCEESTARIVESQRDRTSKEWRAHMKSKATVVGAAWCLPAVRRDWADKKGDRVLGLEGVA